MMSLMKQKIKWITAETVIKFFLGIVIPACGVPLLFMLYHIALIQTIKLSWMLIVFDIVCVVDWCSFLFLPKSYYEWLNRGYNRYIFSFCYVLIYFFVMLTLLMIYQDELDIVSQGNSVRRFWEEIKS